MKKMLEYIKEGREKGKDTEVNGGNVTIKYENNVRSDSG